MPLSMIFRSTWSIRNCRSPTHRSGRCEGSFELSLCPDDQGRIAACPLRISAVYSSWSRHMPLTTYNNVPVPSFMYGTAWKKEATAQLVQLAVAAGFTAIDTANQLIHCLLYTSDAADERSSVDLGGRR